MSGPKGAKVARYRPLRKKVMAPAAGPKLLKWVATGHSAKGHGSAGGAKLLKRAAPWGAEQNC